MRKGIGAIRREVDRTTPWWEKDRLFCDDAWDNYEDYEDHPYSIMGAEPGQRYG